MEATANAARDVLQPATVRVVYSSSGERREGHWRELAYAASHLSIKDGAKTLLRAQRRNNRRRCTMIAITQPDTATGAGGDVTDDDDDNDDDDDDAISSARLSVFGRCFFSGER